MTNWRAIANNVPALQRNRRRPKGASNQLELYIAPRLRYAVPDNVALEAWKRLKERRETKDLLND